MKVSKEEYRNIISYVHSIRITGVLIPIMDKLITLLTALAYAGFLYILFRSKNPLLVRCTVIPAAGFVACTMIRGMLNWKRPYEVYDFEPIIHKETFGKSFPSRHVCSIFLIAMAFLQYDVSMGMVMALMGVMLGILRVFGGVHFPRDVIAGALFGWIFACIGFYVFW